MPADLIAAVIYEESKFEDQTSTAGARGLMQITPDTADTIENLSGGETFVYDDLADPELNIRYGTFYLAYLLDKYDGDVVAALAAYNAGEGNADEWGGAGMKIDDIEFPETYDYVQDVLDRRDEYRQKYATSSGSERPAQSAVARHDPPGAEELQRQPRPEPDRRYPLVTLGVEGHVDVGRVDGREHAEQPPAREPPGGGSDHRDAADDLGDPAPDHQLAMRRQVVGHDRPVGPRHHGSGWRPRRSRRPRAGAARCSSTHPSRPPADAIRRRRGRSLTSAGARVQPQLRLLADGRPAAGDRVAGRGGRGRRAVPDAARRDRHRQDVHDGGHDREARPAGPRHRPQQDPRRAALQRVPRVLPGVVGRVLRLLLRLLPARGIRPGAGPLHREGRDRQRRDRPPSPRRDGEPVRPPGRDHRRLGVLHLRDRVAGAVPRADGALQGRRVDRARDAVPAAHRDAVSAQRHDPHPRQLPGDG